MGKTCLCLRYVHGTFSSEQESTIQATYLEKRLNVGRRAVSLNIWDTAGQERFHALGPIYYRDSHGAVLVYDITDRDSFTKVRHWVKELRKIVGQSIVLVIAGNKADMPPQVAAALSHTAQRRSTRAVQHSTERHERQRWASAVRSAGARLPSCSFRSAISKCTLRCRRAHSRCVCVYLVLLCALCLYVVLCCC